MQIAKLSDVELDDVMRFDEFKSETKRKKASNNGK